jgi:carboxyl-terminal processing protease
LIVGERTYGKGSVQELIPLEDNGGELKLTVAYYYLPSGRLVHRKKGATDWGVEPQIVVPMDDATQRQIMELHSRQEEILPASYKPSTRPSTLPDVVDNQLEQAVNILVSDFLLHGVPPTTQPLAATMPVAATQP